MTAFEALLPLLLLAGESASGFAIQPPGEFHGDEPVARDGERWLALRVDGAAAALVPATLRIELVFDALLDSEGERTGASVSSSVDDERVVAFLRGDGLRAGVVERAVVDPVADADAAPGQRLPAYRIAFRGHAYRIDTRCAPRTGQHPEQAQFDCRIVLSGDGATATLAAMTGYVEADWPTVQLGNDGHAILLFAGDLDRDGKLDLILDTSDHYNVSRPTLFLSGPNEDDGLVTPVATFESVGC